MSDINPGTALSLTQTSAGYPSGASPTTASSGNVANATASAAFGGVFARVPYLVGCVITGAGATAASVVLATITGFAAGTVTIPYAVIAGVTLQGPTLIIPFGFPGIPGGSGGTITLSLPALGTGNTNAAVFVWGYLL